VDIGNSNIAFDIPNAACPVSQSGGCSGQGPRCGISRYSTTDSNLSINATAERLLDTKADQDSDAANTFTFTLNLSGCVSDNSQTWQTAEKIFLDLQMSNTVGDNAAVKFCIRRL